jgi:hypothetical protein
LGWGWSEINILKTMKKRKKIMKQPDLARLTLSLVSVGPTETKNGFLLPVNSLGTKDNDL